MIPLAEINKVAQHYGVPAETIEKDYVISWILLCLAKSKLRDDFIFYGGTAIKRMYFEEHRFSEDIDLISENYFSQNHLERELTCLQFAKNETNLALEVIPNKTLITNDRTQLFIQYSCFDEIIGAPKEIRIDLTMKREIIGECTPREMILSYSDVKQQSMTLVVMSLNTILANKLGLLIDSTRNEPRDVFDIWFLLKRRKKFPFDFRIVCDIFKEKYGFPPSLSLLKNSLQNPAIKRSWNSRLSKQLVALPQVDEVITDINNNLKILFEENHDNTLL